MNKRDLIFTARKYNLEAEVRQDLASGLSPEEIMDKWDML